MSKTVLITGVSSGIGAACAKKFAANGWNVFGISRRPSDNNDIKTLSVDICKEESVKTAIASIGSVDVLVNCAGNGYAGALEDMTEADVRAQMETNFFGTLNVIRAVLPMMRLKRSGTIITVGSVAGQISIPFQSIYSASKAALASVTKALRLETREFDVKCTIVEPGDTKTGFTGARLFSEAAAKSAYKATGERALYTMIRDEMKGKSPETVAEVVFKAANANNPRARYTVCADYKLLVFLTRILPYPLVENILADMYLKTKIPKDAVWTFEKEQSKQ